MPAEYDQTIRIQEATLRVLVEDGLVKAYHNGREVASRRGDLGTLMFQVNEDGKPVVYDIAVLQTGYVRMFVGRKSQQRDTARNSRTRFRRPNGSVRRLSRDPPRARNLPVGEPGS